MLVLAVSAAALATLCMSETDPSQLDAWLVERGLPTSLGSTLRDQGYHAPAALYTAEGTSAVTDKQMKGWGVLPWHRRKFLAAVVLQAEAQAPAPSTAAASDHCDSASSLPADDQECLNEAPHEAAGEADQPPMEMLDAEERDRAPVVELGGVYTVKLAPQFTQLQSLDPIADTEASLGLLFDQGQHPSSPMIVSGVMVDSAAQKAGVLAGSTLVAVNGQPPAPHHFADLDGSQYELSFRGPAPLTATSYGGTLNGTSPEPGQSEAKRSGRRGKRAAASAKKKRKQKRGHHVDATERFHAALQGLKDIPLAEAMFEQSMAATGVVQRSAERDQDKDSVPTSKDIIDLARPMELWTVKGPNPHSSRSTQQDSVSESKPDRLLQLWL